MKGYLKGPEGVFLLAPKVTTVGREGCDLAIQSSNVDQQHAVIEYSDQEQCYVLQDLNTATGTYVNDCRVQNAAVRLAPGDVVRFGFNGTPYELQIDNTQQTPQPGYPVHQQMRAAWTSPYSNPVPTSSLPYLSMPSSQPVTTWVPTGGAPGALPPHPPPSTLRQRPLSAGARRPSYENLQRVGAATSGSPMVQNKTVGWQASRSAGSSPTNDILLLQEKEQKIMRMGDEINRLAAFEAENQRKDQVIAQLQEENNRLRAIQNTGGVFGMDAQLTQKLLELENELSAKKIEIGHLRDQLNRLQQEAAFRGPTTTPDDLKNMKNELERVKKDKNITSGLVTQMQRDMSNKDSTISRLTREIEKLKKDVREKDVQMTAMSAKPGSKMEKKLLLKATEEQAARLRDSKKVDEHSDARDKELMSLRHKFKAAENKVQDMNDLVKSLKEEIEKLKTSVGEEKEGQKKLQAEVDHGKQQYLDMQRAERLVRVDLEQATKRLERFRSRVVQITFSTPGIKAPDGEISDDELLTKLKKVVDERTEFRRKLQDTKESLQVANTTNKEVADSLKALKQHLNDAEGRLRDNGRLARHIKQEINLLQSVGVEDSMQWVKDRVVAFMSSELSWEQDIENALERCGVNVKVSTDEPGKHIANLYNRWESSLSEKEKLNAQIALLETQHKADILEHVTKVKAEMQDKLTDAVEKAKLESEEKMNKAIDEIRSVEQEKRENAVEAERKKIEELQGTVQQLRQNLTAKAEEDKETLESAKEALTQVEDYKKLEAELRDQLAKLEAEKNAEIAELKLSRSDAAEESNKEVTSYKEQIKQHSVTICAMEERVMKLTKKNKDYQTEVTALKQQIQELKSRPPPQPKVVRPKTPPKHTVVVEPGPDVAALEQILLAVRRENQELKSKLQEQQDVILALRRDLAGASARMSDMTGELSEAQKEKLEQSTVQVQQKQRELDEERQKLAKMSAIVDSQKKEIQDYSNEMSKLKSQLNKLKTETSDKNSQVQELELALTREKDEQKKQLSLVEEEGRITSELTSYGAQCRGERHEQVIARQREALAELRQRIKSLEQVRPPVPTHDQALQQVALLKKELAELRANQALAEDKHIMASTSLDRQVSKARGIIHSVNAEADIEKSAHRETMDALDDSENSYLTLLRAIASSLEMEEVKGLRSMSHIPKDERRRLYDDREKSCEMLASRIKVLKERISRKDELLQTYERDLARLRQAEQLAEKKNAQVESLTNDVISKLDETQYLRESLNRTRDRLDQEKRLNSAIKQKKTYHMENEKPEPKWSKHRCPPDDIFGKKAAKERAHREKVKRKNYEMRALKGELTERDRELVQASRRIHDLETSLGLDSEEFVDVE